MNRAAVRPGWLSALAAAAALSGLAACATSRPHRPLSTVLADAHVHDELELSGVIHVVRRGETLYRIARAYGIDVADLMETNGIADPRELSVGQELFVPGAEKVLAVAPASPVPAPAPAPGPSAPATPGPDEPRGRTTSPARAASASPPEAPEHVPAREAEPSRAEPIGRPPSAFGWPLKGVLYGRYGVRDGRRHDGIDLAAPEGTRVGAAAGGEVLYVGEQAGYGRIVILRHPGGLVSLYAHMRKALVEEGRRVERGDPVGEVGQTGRTSGPHLHFEIREGTRPRNPLLYLR